MTDTPRMSVREIETLYDKVRAGKDPDTGGLHITKAEFVAAINALRQQDMEYVIGEDNETSLREISRLLPMDEAMNIRDQNYNRNFLRAEQRGRAYDRLNGTGEKG